MVFLHSRIGCCFLVGIWSALVPVALSVHVGGITGAIPEIQQQEQEQPKICTTRELYEDHPMLCQMLHRRAHESEQLAAEIMTWAKERGLLIEFPSFEEDKKKKEQQKTTLLNKEITSAENNPIFSQQQQQLPVVFAHGMGDSCFNSGMEHITQHAASLLGENVYSTCIPTGATHAEDTSNGYFLNMDASVDVFAAAIQQDPQLSQGFHAIGFSQGNNVIRGYIAKYNDPPVDAFLSINGVNGGVGAVPYCQPTTSITTNTNPNPNLTSDGDNNNNDDDDDDDDEKEYYNYDEAIKDLLSGSSIGGGGKSKRGGMCDLLMEQASRRAYTEFSQEHLFQANYWRDPRPVELKAYQTYSQLAQWGNEGRIFNQTLKDNWSKTNKFVWVLATQDGMVWPKEGEHWGAPDPQNPFHHILPMNETDWYQQDKFGLRTAQEAGKNYFESFEGDHLQFAMEDFDRWVTTYLTNSNNAKETAEVVVE